ncbi:hypothetical protein BGZ63DRAFT_401420 [Mariannaea sp. PMI_226]|nr:hypothetical protein BGZ63DRAFT_401420 [Mariannaea sp. PMI_226]
MTVKERLNRSLRSAGNALAEMGDQWTREGELLFRAPAAPLGCEPSVIVTPHPLRAATYLRFRDPAKVARSLESKPSSRLWSKRPIVLSCFTCSNESSTPHTIKVTSPHHHTKPPTNNKKHTQPPAPAGEALTLSPIPPNSSSTPLRSAVVSVPRSSSAPYDRHDLHESTSLPKQRQQSRPLHTDAPDPPAERVSTPSSQPRSLRRTPKFEGSPSPTPRRVHVEAASVGFTPKPIAAAVEELPEHPTVLGLIPLHSARRPSRRRRRLSQGLLDDPDEVSSELPQSPPRRSSSLRATEPHPVVRISKHTHSAILFALEEALRNPNPFTPDLEEESANMADLMQQSALSATSNGARPATFRPGGAPAPTGSPAGIRGPRMIMQERAAREAAKAEKARQEEEARKRAERRSAGVAPGQEPPAVEPREPTEPQRPPQAAATETTGRNRASTTSQGAPPRPSRTQPVQQPAFPSNAPVSGQAPGPASAAPPTPQPFGQTTEQPAQNTTSTTVAKPRNSFPHAFERWETLSAHWEGLTSYWIRKLEQNKDEVNRDPMNQQLARQVTDLSAAGANLFHAVVELQRLRASSERKFQRWFFETRAELERAQEVNGMLEAALEQERQGRAEAIREAVENERGTSKAQKQLAEMRKELAISKEEARRAWEELGRREQEERDRTLSLQSGQPTIVGGVQVVPMTQGGPSRHTSTRQAAYQAEYGQNYPPVQSQSQPQPQPQQTRAPAPPSVPAETYRGQQSAPPQQPSHYSATGSEGGYSEGEYLIDAQGNFVLDAQGNKIPFQAPASSYGGSDDGAEEYETPSTTNPPSGKQESPSTSAGGNQWTGAYANPQDYTGSGYGTGWDTVPRHHHPTRLSDVIEEEDERSRTSASHSRV